MPRLELNIYKGDSLVAGRVSVKSAVEMLGVTPQAVYQATKHKHRIKGYTLVDEYREFREVMEELEGYAHDPRVTDGLRQLLAGLKEQGASSTAPAPVQKLEREPIGTHWRCIKMDMTSEEMLAYLQERFGWPEELALRTMEYKTKAEEDADVELKRWAGRIAEERS